MNTELRKRLEEAAEIKADAYLCDCMDKGLTTTVSGDFANGFQAEGEPKRKKILIKANTQFPIYVIGYQCRFTMKAPLELMKIAYESGVGSERSLKVKNAES